MLVVVHAVVREKEYGASTCMECFSCAFGWYFRVQSSYKKNLNTENFFKNLGFSSPGEQWWVIRTTPATNILLGYVTTDRSSDTHVRHHPRTYVPIT